MTAWPHLLKKEIYQCSVLNIEFYTDSTKKHKTKGNMESQSMQSRQREWMNTKWHTKSQFYTNKKKQENNENWIKCGITTQYRYYKRTTIKTTKIWNHNHIQTRLHQWKREKHGITTIFRQNCSTPMNKKHEITPIFRQNNTHEEERSTE